MQPHGDARSGRIIAKHAGRESESGDDDVEVAVAIQIGGGDTVRHVIFQPESPFVGHLRERQVPVVSEGDVLTREIRELCELPVPGDGRIGDDALSRIGVVDIPRVAGCDERIFIPVEVDVEQHQSPRPIGCAHAGVVRNFGEGVVAAVHEESVAGVLGAVGDVADREWNGRVPDHLGLLET